MTVEKLRATFKGLEEIAEYMEARADVAGVGKVRELFDGWYRATVDAIALLKAQAQELDPVEPTDMDVTPVTMEYRCGACGRLVGYESAVQGVEEYKFRFCPECGKRVKWGA